MSFTSYNFPDSLGYQQITSLSAATALTIPAGTSLAVIRCETQSVRWRDDGIDPFATVGMLMLAADAPLFYTGQLARLKFIEATASAKLNISYYGKHPTVN